MGDNRGDSADSRILGPIDQNLVIAVDRQSLTMLDSRPRLKPSVTTSGTAQFPRWL
jgi:hypothetical protein